jgi:hypothetical protein
MKQQMPPGTPGGGPGSSAEQMDYIFHELHADSRHALCAVCGSRYRQQPAVNMTSDLSEGARLCAE